MSGGGNRRSASYGGGFEHFLKLVLPIATLPDSPLHGIDHWRSVGRNGARLARATPEADATVVAAFAALHDSQRQSEYDDSEHGQRAAELALAVDLGLTSKQTEVLVTALVAHDRGLVSSDPTIGSCWDADRLDLTRLGIQPDPDLMSTAAGRRWAELIGERSVFA